MDEPNEPASPPRPSKTPSWVLLGFVLGALVVWMMPRENARSSAPIEKITTIQLDRPKATDIEAVFHDWGRYAVWDRDITEVALWDVDKKQYSIFYEILRRGETSRGWEYYFRSIPKLTRPILTHGVRVASPLLYTETEEMRQEWLARGDPGTLPDSSSRDQTTSGDGK